ncbi:MAG: 50S ribosomal protein L28 [Planctomycetaceae bacterium]
MGQECLICGKSTSRGNKVKQRGKAKYLGGNGRKTVGITRRVFRPNLQKIRVQDGSTTVTKRVCVQCIRSGVVTKAVVRKPFTLPK